MQLTVHFKPQKLTVSFKPPTASVSTGTPIAREIVERPAYEGEYTVTPAAEEQVLSTKNLRMTDDITIAPIPSYWGRITHDGSIITVS